MAKSNYPHKQRNGGSNRGALIALLVLLIIAAAVFLLRSCTDGKTPDPAPGGIVYDPGAVEGGWNEADTDKIVDALNEKVERGMINISMMESLTGSENDWTTNTSFSRTLSLMRTNVLSLENLKTSARPIGMPTYLQISCVSSMLELPENTDSWS